MKKREEAPAPGWRKPRRQFGALPYRIGTDGTAEVLLITSRETRRWVIPKGWPMRGRKPHATAAREAFEEAGLVGEVSHKPLGAYAYDKRLKNGSSVPCLVEVFAFAVRQQRKRWPEKDQRDGRWFSLEQAAALVDEPGLKDILHAFEPAEPPRALETA
jgi:8-oxo-dGTP pyrophosphatase MutT (NUDIX family)